MSFPRYPAYKDSGVEWLGEVPDHWQSLRFSRLIAAIKDGTHGTYARVSDGLPLLSAKNVLNGRLESGDSESLISAADHTEITSNGFPRRGDLLLTIVGTIGRCCVFEHDEPIAFQRSVCFIRLLKDHDPRFFYYVTQSQFFQEQLVGKSKSAAQAGVYMGDVAAMVVPLPYCKEERFAIAAFLDHEAAKIDALVAEQERLIELLKEKRQAVISHAVTKGLDPSVPMKDSGVEWLGDVPAHWEVMPLKRDIEFVTSGARGWAENYAEDGDLFIRIGNLTRDTIRLDLSDIQRVTVPDSAEVARTEVQSGDVLFSITAYLGSVAVVPPDLGRAFVSQHVALARPRGHRLQPEWIAYVTASHVGKTCLEMLGYGGTKVQLSLGDVANLLVTVPALHEQEELVHFLDREIANFDALTAEAQRAIGLLQERRTALISAAVTGQIDVRGFVPPRAGA